MPNNNTSKKLVTYVKSKHGEPRPSTRKHHDDDDRSQSEYSSVAPASGYRSEAFKPPKEPRRLEDDDRLGSSPTDARSQRRENLFRHNAESFRSAEMPPVARSLAALPYLPIYEHCAVLRNHGISVKLGPDVFRTMAQQGLIEPRPVSHSHNCSAHHAAPDVYNPSAQEKQAVTEAIVFIVGDCGGEVEMPGFDPQPARQCRTCSNPISSSSPVRRNMDEHNNGNRNSFQSGHGSHPGTYEPRTQGNIPIGLASPYEDARSEVHWDGHGR